MSFQPALNDDFVGVELTLAQRLATSDVILGTSPFSHRLFFEVQLTGDLGKIQAALLMQEPDLRVKLVGDHGCLGPSASNILRRIALRGSAWPVRGAGCSLLISALDSAPDRGEP